MKIDPFGSFEPSGIIEADIVARLRELQPQNGDIELAHIEADELIIDFLRKLGYSAIADAWKDVPKWYA